MARYVLTIVLAGLFVIAGAYGLWIVNGDYRDAIALRALDSVSTADSAEAIDARVNRAADALKGPAQTGALHERKARLALNIAPPDLAQSAEESREALRVSPARGESWARLAYLEATQAGEFSPEALAALNRAFVTTPVEVRDFQLWRVEFALSNWDRLDDEAKGHVRRAIEVLTDRGRNMGAVTQLADRLPDPEARQFVLDQIEAP